MDQNIKKRNKRDKVQGETEEYNITNKQETETETETEKETETETETKKKIKKKKEKKHESRNESANESEIEIENASYINRKHARSNSFNKKKVKNTEYVEDDCNGEFVNMISDNDENSMFISEEISDDFNGPKINDIFSRKRKKNIKKGTYEERDISSDESRKEKNMVNKRKIQKRKLNDGYTTKSMEKCELMVKDSHGEREYIFSKGNQVENEKKRRSVKGNKDLKELKHFKEFINGKEPNRPSHMMKMSGSTKMNNMLKIKSNSMGGICYSSTSNHIHHHHHHNSLSHNMVVHSKEERSKYQTFKIRFIWTIILIGIFFLILAAGHFYCSVLVLILVTIVYNEIISLKSIENKDKKLPQIFYIRWYWFVLTIVNVGIPWLIPKLNFKKSFFNYVLVYHSIIMFISAFLGFVWFILSLRKFSLKYQFSQIGIILLCSLLIVTQSLMHIANIYAGLIWFVVPVSSVIVNDIFAYILGLLFGKTRLIQLSPKKTVEGYVGSSIITILWGLLVTWALQKHKFFICPQPYITFKPFETWKTINCEEDAIFQSKVYVLPKTFFSLLHLKEIYYTKMIFHGLVLSLFAAFLAPFGGFFASGFKRALKIKDFGKSIPGHGGVTDRFDCQIFIGMFTYLYMKTFARKKTKFHVYYSIIDSINKLDEDDQRKIFQHLKQILDKKIEALKSSQSIDNEIYTYKDDLFLNDKCYDIHALQKYR